MDKEKINNNKTLKVIETEAKAYKNYRLTIK